MRIKDKIFFSFAHLRYCHNGWASNISTQNVACPSITTPSKMGKTKVIFYSLSEVAHDGKYGKWSRLFLLT